MDSFDSANLLSGGSRLLSQSPQFSFNNNSASSSSSHTHTGPGGEDLSLSELELEPQTQTRPQTRHHHNPKSRTRPSIAQALGFGAPLDQSADDLSVLEEEGDAGEEREEGEEEQGAEVEADVTMRVGGAEKTVIAAQSREEKLQGDLFVLRQLNGAFAVYNDALREAQGGTEVSQVFHAFAREPFFLSLFTHYYYTLSVSPSNWNRQTRYSTNTSTFYPSRRRSRGLYSMRGGWAPRRYAGYPLFSIYFFPHVEA
jgi:hypothetical protein